MDKRQKVTSVIVLVAAAGCASPRREPFVTPRPETGLTIEVNQGHGAAYAHHMDYSVFVDCGPRSAPVPLEPHGSVVGGRIHLPWPEQCGDMIPEVYVYLAPSPRRCDDRQCARHTVTRTHPRIVCDLRCHVGPARVHELAVEDFVCPGHDVRVSASGAGGESWTATGCGQMATYQCRLMDMDCALSAHHGEDAAPR